MSIRVIFWVAKSWGYFGILGIVREYMGIVREYMDKDMDIFILFGVKKIT